MLTLRNEQTNGQKPGPGPGGGALGRRLWWEVAAIAAATIVLQLGVLLLPGAFGVAPRAAMLAVLMASGVWVALAAPILAAGAPGALAAVLRGGIVADATAVLLVVLWLTRPEVTFLAAVEMYCIYASVALCGVAAGCVASTPAGRYAAAVVATVVLLAVQAGPFWLPGVCQFVAQGHKTAVAGIGLRANPVYGIFSAMAGDSGFVWHFDAPLMYRITQLGEDIPVPVVRWYHPVAIYLGAAGILAATHLVRRRRVWPG